MKKIIYFMIVVISIFLKTNVLAEQKKGKLFQNYVDKMEILCYYRAHVWGNFIWTELK